MLKIFKNLSSIATIYETYDYEMFDKVNSNRVINQLNYTKL